MKQFVIVLLAAVFMVTGRASAAPAGQKAGEPPKKIKPLVATILKVEGPKITLSVSGKVAGEMALTTDEKTAVEIKGHPAKVADLKPGMIVTIDPPTGAPKKITVADLKGGGKSKKKDEKKDGK